MAQTIKDILRKKVGDDEHLEEALSYYQQYQTSSPFAVIKISGSCIDSSLDVITKDLSDLHELGLLPVVTYGFGDMLSEKLAKEGIIAPFIAGERRTDAAAMKHVEDIAERVSNRIVYGIGKEKARLLDYESRILYAQDKTEEGYEEHNGDITHLFFEPIQETLQDGYIPIVSPIGTSEDGKKNYNINSADVGARLAKELKTVKYVLLTATNGVLDKTGKTIDTLELNDDYQRLVDDGIIKDGMLKNVREAHSVLSCANNLESVQIVRPSNLFYELFTKKGAGTYITRAKARNLVSTQHP